MKICKSYRAIVGLAMIATFAFAQKPKSQKEVDALMAAQNATDPDARIAAVENVLSKFADTEFKPMLLLMAADAAQRKGDYEKMVIYGERTLEADPKNYQAMIMLAGGIAQHTREFDLDREDKLNRAEKLAKQGIDLAKTAPKPNPQITDEQWEGAKKDYMAQGHEALGQAALVRKKYDVASQEWKTAIETGATPDGATYVRLANAYNQMKKPDEAIATLDKLSSIPDLHPQIKTAATQERNTAMKLKGGAGSGASAATGAPAATAPAPPAAAPVK